MARAIAASNSRSNAAGWSSITKCLDGVIIATASGSTGILVNAGTTGAVTVGANLALMALLLGLPIGVLIVRSFDTPTGLGLDFVRWHYLVLGLETFAQMGVVATRGLMLNTGLCLGLTYY